MSLKKFSERIVEDQVSTGDMAPGFDRITPKKQFRDLPCFDLDKECEYNSFCQGKKIHARWARHTKLGEVRQWASENPGKDFYVSHNNSYTKVVRKKG